MMITPICMPRQLPVLVKIPVYAPSRWPWMMLNSETCQSVKSPFTRLRKSPCTPDASPRVTQALVAHDAEAALVGAAQTGSLCL